MEDLAIGISKTAVQELVKRVKNAKKEEEKQWQTVERDIVFMKHEFEMIQSFLASAAGGGDGEGRFRGDVERTWVRQVRELSDGAEDCIDYVLHLDTERSLWTLCLRVLPSCMRMTGGAMLPLDRAVCDIEQLKAMVEDVSKRNMRYSGLGSGDSSGSSKLVPVAGHTQLIASSAASASTLLDIFVNPSDAAKDKAAIDRLIEFMSGGNQHLGIFSVCGTGGDLGTISIARKVYEDPAFCSQFPLRAWVKLTQPFDSHGFVGSLVDQFEANYRRQQGKTIVTAAAAQQPPPEKLVAKFVEDICNIKYLIVLEDVLSMAGWDAARAFLPDQNNGSRVIVLTHQLEIARLCTGTKPVQVSPLREFSHRHSVYVFYQEQTDSAVTTEAETSGNDAIMEAEASSQDSDDVKKLEELITSSDRRGTSRHWISVCGISDARKLSSVVKTIYDRCLKREVQEDLFDGYAWVVVPDPLDIDEFCRRLHWIMKGGSRDHDANIKSECMMELYMRRHLIFIDGLQSKANWDLITTKLTLSKFPKCCIVAVTKEEHVAQHCAAHQSLVCNIGDQGDLDPHPLQYQQHDADDMIKPKGSSSRLAKAYYWLCSNHLLGRDSSGEKKLEELITSPDCRGKHHVISVCGIAGAGKSFIVRTMYYRCIQREMREDLFGEYVWVEVPHHFEIMEFCRRLFFNWTGASVGGQDFVSECWKLLHQRRVLVVIDGLRSMDDWDSIQAMLRLATSTSCIVVVTTYPSVARHCATTKDEICSITSLREDATRRLITDKIVQQQGDVPGTSEQDPNLTEEAFVITNKCGRFPVVVCALQTYLVSKQQGGADTKIAALRHLNDNFINELKANPDQLDGLPKVLTWMHSNIHACPQVIKKCIFYLWIFHQGSSIRRDRLVRRWIAEGYSEGIDSISMVLYTETKLFHKLAELGMIAKPAAAQSSCGTGTMTLSSCQVNSLFLEYITLRETEESIFLPLEVTVLEGGRSPPRTQHVGQHLAIRDWKGEKAVFNCLDLTRLRSLTVSGQWQRFFVSDMMLVLRVLDLEGTTSNLRDGDLKQIVEQLRRLKFLSLRGCKEITRLPRSMGGLRQLQALDVRGTSVVRLPGSIVKLHKLQYLRAGDGQGGVRVPIGIGELKALQTLGAIDVSSSCTGVAILNELHGLQQLRKLHVSGIIQRHNSLCVCVACFISGGQASSWSSIRFPTNSFGELKVLEIACSPRIHVQFAQGAVPKLEKMKLYCHHGSSLQFSGLEFLRSPLKKILLKGPGCNTVRDSLQVQLDQQIQNNQIVPEIAPGHGLQPQPDPAQGNQEMPASSLAEDVSNATTSSPSHGASNQ